MPLPGNGPLSLQGHSRPGDTVHSKPKQAMIVRMSAETLEALEAFPNQPPMDFEFGDNPGIYIGETFFPMRPLKEGPSHELYLRTSSSAKPMAPLKLYANVVGKFTVERELGEKVQDKVRDRTLEAEKQRTGRMIKLVDLPPELPVVNGKKRKAPPPSTMFRKPTQHADRLRNMSTSTPLPAPTTSSLPPTSTTPENLIPVRKRLVHCLAVSPRTSDEVIRLVGGSHCDATLRNDLLGLLDQVAEQTDPAKKGADKTLRPWRLKASTWLEVRPYEWPKLTESERTSMSRAARLTYKNLNIPESDPAWNYVRYRQTNTIPSASPSRPSTSGTVSGSGTGTPMVAAKAAEAKRGVSSKEVKEKKAKAAKAEAAARPKAEVLMKDESVKAAPRVSNVGAKGKEGSNATAPGQASAAKPANRRVPGSGFKVVKASSQDPRLDGGADVARSPPDVGTKREPPASSLPAKPMSLAPNQDKKASGDVAGVVAARQVKRIREGTTNATDSDRERDTDRERDRDKIRAREDTSVAKLKRKKPVLDDSEEGQARSSSVVQKKRRLDEGSGLTPPVSKDRVRDVSLPKKPEPGFPPRLKMKKESSPHPLSQPPGPPQRSRPKLEPSPMPSTQPPLAALPRQKIRKEPSPSPSPSMASHQKAPTGPGASLPLHTSSQMDKSSKATAVSKSRRRSPIYTSSEDEGEIRRFNKRDRAVAPASLPTSPTMHTSRHHFHPRAHMPAPLPTDRAGLRARYNSSYLDYITSFQMVVAQKRKIEGLLRSGGGSVGSLTDSDGDVELMDTEELLRLSAEHKMLKGELEEIRKVFLRSGKVGSSSD